MEIRSRLFLTGVFVAGSLLCLGVLLISLSPLWSISFFIGWVILAVAGASARNFEKVETNARGLLTYTRLGGSISEHEIGPGRCWLVPGLFSLKQYPVGPRDEAISNFRVEMRGRLDVYVSVTFRWQVAKGGLKFFAEMGRAQPALKNLVEGTIKSFLGFVGRGDEANYGEMQVILKSVLTETLNKRCDGVETKLVGASWRKLRPVPLDESRASPWGIDVFDVHVPRLDSEGGVKEAIEDTEVAVIRSGVLPAVATAAGSAVATLRKSGVDSDTAMQHVHAHLKPRAPPLPHITTQFVVQPERGGGIRLPGDLIPMPGDKRGDLPTTPEQLPPAGAPKKDQGS